ncbi:MAG: pyridoxine 5'-phosphate synthase [Ignavibacteriales bacterium]|nr:pyridoxine 5'-phosphate synthase [Ignavibacteriales bacterium]
MRLSINIDHIATLRNARGGKEPDPIAAAYIAELAGAEGIVCHLREDRRHIRDRDVELLRETVKTKLDLEMSINEEILSIAENIVPNLATLVPEKREELTTEGGLDVIKNRTKLKRAIARLHDKGIAVSLFVDPVREQIEMANEINAEMIELHTGDYANATTEIKRIIQLQRLQTAASFAHSLGLTVNAGHGLNYTNIFPILTIREIEEVSIGHAIIAQAAFVGLFDAVNEMARIVHR